MPSPTGYVRNYKHEYATSKQRGEQGTGSDSGGAERMRARRAAMKLGMVKKGDHKDLDHRIALSKGGSNKRSNWRIESEHANRSYPRRSDGSMIANHEETKG